MLRLRRFTFRESLSQARNLQRRLCSSAARVTRASAWWEYKIAVILGVAYAMAYVSHLHTSTLAVLLLQWMAACVPGTAYVCILNDLTDLEDDLRAGKANRLAGKSAIFKAGALSLCLLAGAIMGMSFRAYPVTLYLYAANWVVFTLYSVPPFRFKVRGAWGVLMDSCGGQFLPTLWTASFIFEAQGKSLPLSVACALGLWSLALGVRGILQHQWCDLENDRRSGVPTLAVRRGGPLVHFLIQWITFPLEALALLWLLLQIGPGSIAGALLFFAGVLQWLRVRYFKVQLVLATNLPGKQELMTEYYQFFFPMTFLWAMALYDPLAWILVGLHACLFPRCSKRIARNVYHLVRWNLLAHRAKTPVAEVISVSQSPP